MAKRIFAAIMAIMVIITMSFNVFATEDATALTITTIYGNKSNIYVGLSESVTGENLSATITKFGSQNPINATATLKNETSSSTDVVITPATKLDIDSYYTLSVTSGGKTAEKSFKFKVLVDENFDSGSTDVFHNDGHWEVNNQMFLRKDWAFYATITKSALADESWSDYTVEFDYYDTLSTVDKKDGTEQNIKLATLFYLDSNASKTINQNGGNIYDETNGVRTALSNIVGDKVYYVSANGTSREEITPESVTDGVASFNNKNVTYSASLFGKDVYSTVVDKETGAMLYSSNATIPNNLYRTSGGFGILARTKYTKIVDNEEKSGDGWATYMDNLLCYKLEEVEVSYGENEAFALYGSKNNIVAKFNNDVVKASATLTAYDGTQIPVDSEYKDKVLTVKPETSLSIDGVYKINISYGVACEHNADEVVFNYTILHSDDFESNTSSLYNAWGGATVEDGHIRGGHPVYGPVLKSTTENNEWKDYTVEYKVKSSEDYGINYFRTVFYANNGAHTNYNESYGNIGISVIAGASNGVDFNNNGTKDTSTVTTASYPNGSINKDTFKAAGKTYISEASVFDNLVYASVKDSDNKVYSTSTATLSATPKYTKGSFGFNANPNPEKTGDVTNFCYTEEVLAYKLNVIDTSNIDYENVTVTTYGSRGALVFDFDKDVVKATASLNNGTDVEASYDSLKKRLVVTPAVDLDLKSQYTITLNYGLALEKSETVKFGYEILYKDDFDSSIISNALMDNTDYIGNGIVWGVDNGRLIKGDVLPTYAMQIKHNADSAAWTNYTVEFDFIGKKEIERTNGDKDQNHSNLALKVFFYTWHYDAQYNKNNTVGGNDAVLIEPNQTKFYGNAIVLNPGENDCKDYKVQASMFGDVAMGKVTDITNGGHSVVVNTVGLPNLADGATANYVRTGTNDENGHKTSGTFAFGGDYGWNDATGNTYDNLVCYKLYVIEDDSVVLNYASVSTNVEEQTLTVNGLTYQNLDNATPIVAVYDESGLLIGTAIGESKAENITVTGVDSSKAVKIKLMVWDSARGLTALRDAMLVY